MECAWCKKSIEDHESIDQLEECLEHLSLECQELYEKWKKKLEISAENQTE